GGNSVTHQGFYASAGLFLTGENRAYNAEDGSWGRVRPLDPVTDGGLGAWQLAGRFDYVDYDDPLVAGDKAHALTLGLNWHLIPYARIMANWVYWDIVGANDDSGHHFGMRAQVDW
ncbi:MAG: porin, partial [Hyphomicrobiales bacterium]